MYNTVPMTSIYDIIMFSLNWRGRQPQLGLRMWIVCFQILIKIEWLPNITCQIGLFTLVNEIFFLNTMAVSSCRNVAYHVTVYPLLFVPAWRYTGILVYQSTPPWTTILHLATKIWEAFFIKKSKRWYNQPLPI